MFRHDSSQQTTDSEAQVPAREDAAVGGASLVVPGYVDEHIEERGIEVSVAQSDECCRKVVCHGVGDGHEDDESHQGE